MAKKKEQVGQGLRALLTKIDKTEDQKTTPNKEKQKAGDGSVAEINIDHIEPNPYQPRKEFKEEELLELVQSIKALGLIQPITVRQIDKSLYQIISGERRWRASKLAGLRKVPAYIRKANDQGMLEMALVENIQRSDLNALEVSLSYKRLIDECNLQHDELAKRVGKNRSTVTNYIRLLKLPPDLQEGLKNDKISMGHARAMLGLDDPSEQLFIYNRIIEDNLSVRHTESLVKSLKESSSPDFNSKMPTSQSGNNHPEVVKIKDRLSHVFGTKVNIVRNASGKGRIIIPFTSDNQFNDIIDSIEDSK